MRTHKSENAYPPAWTTQLTGKKLFSIKTNPQRNVCRYVPNSQKNSMGSTRPTNASKRAPKQPMGITIQEFASISVFFNILNSLGKISWPTFASKTVLILILLITQLVLVNWYVQMEVTPITLQKDAFINVLSTLFHLALLSESKGLVYIIVPMELTLMNFPGLAWPSALKLLSSTITISRQTNASEYVYSHTLLRFNHKTA